MESNSSKKINVILIVVILLLIGALGFLYTKYSSSLETIKNIEENLVQINVEKQKLMTELDSLEQEIVKQMGQNAQLDSILLEKQAEIDQIRVVLRSQKADISEIAKYKKQIDVLTLQVQEYIRKNAQLQHAVDSLKFDSSIKQQKIDTLQIADFEKAKKIEELVEKVEIGSQLRVADMTVVAYNKKNKPITRAKRVDKFEVSGTMMKNVLAASGKRTVFLRITSPSGIVLTQNPGNQFDFDGKTIMFSDKKEISYNNNDVKIQIYYDAANDNLELGTYRVSLFCDGKEVGKTELELK